MSERTEIGPIRRFSDRRVLVTGASGFIGTRLCEALLSEGAIVHAVSRRVQAEPVVHWHTGDLQDSATVANLMRAVDPDLVFHLAGLVSGSRSAEILVPMFEANLVASMHVMHAVLNSKRCRLVLAGSLEEPEPDHCEPVPGSPYAASKWAVSTYARMMRALYELDVVNCRIFMTYGPGRQDNGKLVPYVITSLLGGDSPRLSSGTRPVDWIYVDDVVSGLLASAAAPDLKSRSVDLGTGILTPIAEVVRSIFEQMGVAASPAFGSLPDRPLERIRAANLDSTRTLIGWAPSVNLTEGLRRTIIWYRGHQHANVFRNGAG